jgi:TRAP-type uncharacterized transport system substrate-binding protein
MFTRRTLLSLFLVGMMFLGSSAPVCASTKLTAGAIGTTSDTYMLAMGWANALNEVGSSVSITPLEGGGTVQLLRGLVSNRWDIGFIGSPHYGNALAGELNFEKDPPELRERYKKANNTALAINVLFSVLLHKRPSIFVPFPCPTWNH